MNTKAYFRAAIPGMLLLALSACVYTSKNVQYPEEWQKGDGTRVGTCPDLGGRYGAIGEEYIESGVNCRASGSVQPRDEWKCSVSLPENLTGRYAHGISWELSQPNEEVLTLTAVYGPGSRGESIELLRKKDFDCMSGSLVTRHSGSLLGGPLATGLGLVFLSGGYVTVRRSFTRNTAGELVMQVRESSGMYHLVVGGMASGTSYVRWLPVPAPLGGAP